MAQQELISGLQHLSNVFEIVCLSSELVDFQTESFKVGYEYDSRLLGDLEIGVKSWLNLDRCIDSTCWAYAQKMVSTSNSDPSQSFTEHSEIIHRRCSSWNSFKKDGCQFEFLNPGKSCKYVHCCSIWKANHLCQVPHKA